MDSNKMTWLDRVGKKVGLDFSKHLANGKWIFLKFGVVAIGGWLLSFVFARLGTRETLGQYQYVLSLLMMVSICALPGLNTAALEAVAKGRDGGVIRAKQLSFFFSLIASLVLVMLGLYKIFFTSHVLLGETLIAAGILAPLYYAFNIWNIYYDGKSLFKESSLRTIVLYIFLYIALITGLFLKFDVFGLILVYLLVYIILQGFYFLEVTKKIENRADDHIDFWFGVNSSIQRFVFGLSNNIPALAIAALFGIEAVAIYFIGYFLINAGSSLMGMLGYLYIPALFRGEKIFYKKVLLQNLAVGIIFWIGFLVFIQYLFIPIYGIKYIESQKLAFSFSLLMIIVPLKIFLMNFFLTAKKNWTIIAVVILANILSLGILYLARGYGFSISIITYIYALELLALIPMLFIYLQDGISKPVKKEF